MAESIDLFGNLGGTLHDTLAGLPDGARLARDESTGAMVVLRHPDVENLAHDARLAGIGLSFFDMMGIKDGPLRDWYGAIMFTNEGATHQRLRSLVARAFTPRAVEALRGTAAAMSAETVAAVGPDGGDLFGACATVPTRVMCRLLGVPDGDLPGFVAWADALSPIFLVMTPEQVDAATAAIVELVAYVGQLTEQRRHDPGPDLITALLAAEDRGDRLTHDELVTMVANLIVAGHDTTTSQLGCSLLVLFDQAEEARGVRTDDPALLTSLVSETIRLQPSIPIVPRTAMAPIEIDGTEIPAGVMVMLCSATANRDTEVWKEPDRFHPRRFTEAGCPKLMTFGAGPHYCLGAALARVTIEEVVRAALAVDPPLRLTHDISAIPWRVILGRSPARLRVTTEAA